MILTLASAWDRVMDFLFFIPLGFILLIYCDGNFIAEQYLEFFLGINKVESFFFFFEKLLYQILDKIISHFY